jgi:hypothetical protein
MVLKTNPLPSFPQQESGGGSNANINFLCLPHHIISQDTEMLVEGKYQCFASENIFPSAFAFRCSIP